MIEEDGFIEGERRIGRYTIVILQRNNGGHWSPSVMQLDCLISNYRLMLRPLRKNYAPASIPARYISTMQMARQGRYTCIAIGLVTGHYLYLIMATGKLEDFFDDLRAMRVPPARMTFDDHVAREDIVRLITFFGREPLPEASPSEPS